MNEFEFRPTSIDEVIAYNRGYKKGCEDMQETYYKRLKPLYEYCVKLENVVREKINSAPNDAFETPFILRVEWETKLRERTAFREMLETVIEKGALECLTVK